MAMVVLPVARSPMISSRWPRPIGIIASTAMIPVCTGWLTLLRSMMPKAMFSVRIKLRGFDRSLAIERLSQGIHYATKQTFADRGLQEASGGLDLVAFADRCIVAEDDRAHLRLLEVERQSVNAARKLEHFVEHRGAEAFDLGHAVADFPDDANVGFGGGSALDAFDFAFEFLQNVAHGWTGLELLGECGRGGCSRCRPRRRCRA